MVSVLPLAMRKRSPATVMVAPPLRLRPCPWTLKLLAVSEASWPSLTLAPPEMSARLLPVASAALRVKLSSGALALTRSITAPLLTESSPPALVAVVPTRSTRAGAPLPTKPRRLRRAGGNQIAG